MSNDQELKEKLIQLVKSVVETDKALREQFQIGDKFRFIRDRLNALLSHTESSFAGLEVESEKKSTEMSADEMLVYIYLFNAQGLVIQTWQKMVNSSVFYEHSVNRPIYTEKSHIESFIRGKSNKAQHGYLTIIIKKQDISRAPGTELLKDANNNPLIKVREGSLHFEKLISFTQNGNDYTLNKNGELIKKNNPD